MNDSQIAEWFKEHVASRTKMADGNGNEVDMLIWAEPGITTYKMVFIHHKNMLMVYGDLGEAVYGWSSLNSLEWIAACEIGYFASKCEASEYGWQYREWDEQEALRCIQGYLEEPEKMKLFKENDGESSMGNQHDWIEWLRLHGDEVFGQDWWEFAPSIGETIAVRCRAHLIGLKMAIKLQTATEKEPAPGVQKP